MSTTRADGELLVILKPETEGEEDEGRRRLEDKLAEAGAAFVIEETTPERDGEAIVQAADTDVGRIVACGGDGTVNAVVHALVKHKRDADIELAIVPMGTANLLAGSLGIPEDLEDAVDLALSGTARRVDCGDCSGRIFVLGIGAGVTERFVAEAEEEQKKFWGKLAYAVKMAGQAGAEPASFTIQMDDGRVIREEAAAVVVANAPHIAGIPTSPDARLDDGFLDLCLVHTFEWGDILEMSWRAVSGKLPDDESLTFHQSSRYVIEAEPALPVQVDGETLDITTPLDIRCLPGALRIVAPEE